MRRAFAARRPLAAGRRTHGPLVVRGPRRVNARIQVVRGPGPLRRLALALARALPVALATLVLSAAALGAVGLGQRLVRHPRLAVRSLEIVGAGRLGEAAVRAACGDVVGQPLFTLDTEALAARVGSSPWVRAVSVQRRLPGTVRIRLALHAPRLWVSLGRLYVAAADGTLFKPFAAADRLDLPVLTGLGDGSPAGGPSAAVAARVGEAVALAAATAPWAGVLGTLQEIHWQDETGWSIVSSMRQQTGRLHLGFAPQGRLAAAVAAVQALGPTAPLPRIVWADGVKNPRRVALSLAPEGPTRGQRTAPPPPKGG